MHAPEITTLFRPEEKRKKARFARRRHFPRSPNRASPRSDFLIITAVRLRFRLAFARRYLTRVVKNARALSKDRGGTLERIDLCFQDEFGDVQKLETNFPARIEREDRSSRWADTGARTRAVRNATNRSNRCARRSARFELSPRGIRARCSRAHYEIRPLARLYELKSFNDKTWYIRMKYPVLIAVFKMRDEYFIEALAYIFYYVSFRLDRFVTFFATVFNNIYNSLLLLRCLSRTLHRFLSSMRKCMKYEKRYSRITLYVLAIKSIIQCAESESWLNQFLKVLSLRVNY